MFKKKVKENKAVQRTYKLDLVMSSENTEIYITEINERELDGILVSKL